MQTVQRPTTQSDPVEATILDDATETDQKTVDNVDEDIRSVRPKGEDWKYKIFEICVKTDVSLQMQGIPEPLRALMCWNLTFMLRIAFWQTSVADLDGWLGTQCVGRPEVRLGRLVTDSSSRYTTRQILLTHHEEYMN